MDFVINKENYLKENKKVEIAHKNVMFKTAKEKYGLWPLTVWDINKNNKENNKLKKMIDDGSGRKECSNINYGINKSMTSIFDPQIVQFIINMYIKEKNKIVYDPFGGGGTRGIICGSNGLKYYGNELRKEEFDLLIGKIKDLDFKDNIKFFNQDSQNANKLEGDFADFLITCPPYYNLEKYNGGMNDLSMVGSYEEFLNGIEKVIRESYRILKDGALSFWVVGLMCENNKLLMLNHDLTYLHKKCGFEIKEEVVLNNINSGSIQRVGYFDRGNNYLIRVHEYLLIFKK